MNESIKKAIRQAVEIVKASKVSNEFASSTYEIVLAHLLQKNEVVDRESVTGTESLDQPMQPASQFSSWSSLVEQKNPANLYQLVALIVYYLEKQKSNEQQEDSLVSSKEIEEFLGKECTDRIEDKDFDNLKARIRHTVSQYKYIKSKKKGYYVITPLGRKVIGRLPDQPQKSRGRK